MIPIEDCNDVHPLRPTECRRCGTKLSGNDPRPLRHQVWELPEIPGVFVAHSREPKLLHPLLRAMWR